MVRAPVFATLLLAWLAACGPTTEPLQEVGRVTEKARAGDDKSLALLVEYFTSPVEGEALAALTAVTEAGERAVPALVAALEREDPVTLEFALGALGRIRDPRAVDPLLEGLGRPGFPVYTSLWALGEIGSMKALPALVERLGDPNAEIRKGATRALIKFGNRAVPAVIEALGDSSPAARHYAARVLGQSEDPRAAAPLMERYADIEPEVALWALGRLRAREAFPIIAREVGNSDWRIRLAAVQALEALQDERGLTVLRSALEDPEWIIREWAARGLEHLTKERQLYRDRTGEMVVPYNLYR